MSVHVGINLGGVAPALPRGRPAGHAALLAVRGRPSGSLCLQAPQMAAMLLALGALGISRLGRSTCLGSDLVNRLLVESDGRVSWVPVYGALRRRRLLAQARAHALVGHDSGCVTLGVSLREVRSFLSRYDATEVLPLLLEALADVIADLLERGSRGVISSEQAYETLQLHVQRRITPAQMTAVCGEFPLAAAEKLCHGER